MKNANVSTVSEYKKLPKPEREVFGFWYKTPEFYEWGGESFEEYWKHNYPIQFRIRDGFQNFCISCAILKEKLINTTWKKLFSDNKWAKSVIPDTWCDKPEIIEKVLFASIIDFVENEPVKYVDWSSDNKRAIVWDKINESYKFVKHTLPARRKQIEEMTTELYSEDTFTESSLFDTLKEELASLENSTDIEVQKHLLQIVKIRQYLWT